MKIVKRSLSLAAIAMVIISCDSSLFKNGKSILSQSAASVSNLTLPPSNARTAFHVQALQIGEEMLSDVKLNLTANSNLTSTQINFIIDGAHSKLASHVNQLVISDSALMASFALADQNNDHTSFNLADEAITSSSPLMLVVGPAVVSSTMESMSEDKSIDQGGSKTSKTDAASSVMSSSFSALKGRSKNLNNKALAGIAKRMMGSAVESFKAIGFTKEKIAAGTKAVTQGAVSALESSGLPSSAMTEVAKAVVSGVVSSLKSVDATSIYTVQAISGAATGAVNGMKNFTMNKGDGAKLVGEMAASSVSSMSALGLSNNTIMDVAQSVSTSVISNLKSSNFTGTSLGAAVQSVAGKMVSSFDSKTFDSATIAQGAKSIVAGAMNGIGEAGISSGSGTTGNSIIKEVMIGAVGSLGNTGMGSADIAKSMKTVMTGAVESLKNVKITKNISFNDMLRDTMSGSMESMSNAGLKDVSAISMAVENINRGVISALPQAGQNVNTMADMAYFVTNTSMKLIGSVGLTSASDLKTIGGSVALGVSTSLGDMQQKGLFSEEILRQSTLQVSTGAIDGLQTLSKKGVIASTSMASFSSNIATGVFNGLAFGGVGVDFMTSVKSEVNTSFVSGLQSYGASASDISYIQNFITSAAEASTTLASNIQGQNFTLCSNYPSTLSDKDMLASVENLPNPVMCSPGQTSTCPNHRYITLSAGSVDLSWNLLFIGTSNICQLNRVYQGSAGGTYASPNPALADPTALSVYVMNYPMGTVSNYVYDMQVYGTALSTGYAFKILSASNIADTPYQFCSQPTGYSQTFPMTYVNGSYSAPLHLEIPADVNKEVFLCVVGVDNAGNYGYSIPFFTTWDLGSGTSNTLSVAGLPTDYTISSSYSYTGYVGGSDFTQYKWAIGEDSSLNCNDASSLAGQLIDKVSSPSFVINFSPTAYANGTLLKLCVVPYNSGTGTWKNPFVLHWYYDSSYTGGLPVAAVTGAPSGISSVRFPQITVNGPQVFKYKYALGSPSIDCSNPSSYGTLYDVGNPINLDLSYYIANLIDGSIHDVKLCVIGHSANNLIQSYASPTILTWQFLHNINSAPSISTSVISSKYTQYPSVIIYPGSNTDRFRYKLASTAGNCDAPSNHSDYNSETVLSGSYTIYPSLSAAGFTTDGTTVYLCTIGGTTAGQYQQNASVMSWVYHDSTRLQIAVTGAPSGTSYLSSVQIYVNSSSSPTNVTQYRFAFGSNISCYSASYGPAIPISTPLNLNLVSLGIASGNYVYLCVVGGDAQGEWQTSAASFNWNYIIQPLSFLKNDFYARVGSTLTYDLIGPTPYTFQNIYPSACQTNGIISAGNAYISGLNYAEFTHQTSCATGYQTMTFSVTNGATTANASAHFYGSGQRDPVFAVNPNLVMPGDEPKLGVVNPINMGDGTNYTAYGKITAITQSLNGGFISIGSADLNADGIPDEALTLNKYNSNGTPDLNFNTAVGQGLNAVKVTSIGGVSGMTFGLVPTSAVRNATNNKLYVAGKIVFYNVSAAYAPDSSRVFIAAFNDDPSAGSAYGTLDTSFGGSSYGTAGSPPGFNIFPLANSSLKVLGATTAAATPAGSGIYDNIFAIDLQGTNLVIAGHTNLSAVGYPTSVVIMQLANNGSISTAFGSATSQGGRVKAYDGIGYDLKSLPTESNALLFVGQKPGTYNEWTVMKTDSNAVSIMYTANSSTTFGSPRVSAAQKILLNGGMYYVAGKSLVTGTDYQTALVRYTSTLVNDASFASGTGNVFTYNAGLDDENITSMAWDPYAADILLGGTRGVYSNIPQSNFIVKINSGGLFDTMFGGTGFTSMGPASNPATYSLTGMLYVDDMDPMLRRIVTGGTLYDGTNNYPLIMGIIP